MTTEDEPELLPLKDPRVFHAGPSLICINCNRGLPAVAETFDRSFEGKPYVCTHCGDEGDWWERILGDIRVHFMFEGAAILAGAFTTYVDTYLAAGESKELDLTAHGVPADAEIIGLNMTSAGGPRPLLIHSNDVMNPVRPHLWIYGCVYPQKGSEAGQLFVRAIWFSPSSSDAILRHLIEAARLYGRERFDALIVPANIAAEAALSPVAARGIKRFGNRKAREAFLTDATYAHRLNILLDLAADLSGAPRLPAKIKSILDRLRRFRNKMMHEGSCEPQTRDLAAEHISATIFALHYARFLATRLDKAGPSGDSDET